MAKEKKQTFAHDLATAKGQVEGQASALRICAYSCTQLMMVDFSRAAAMLFVPSAESAYRTSLKNAHDIHPETLFL